MSSSVWVVTPTYNERLNIESHVAALRQAVPKAQILIVDDGSPDGTGDVAEALAAGDPLVRVLHRQTKEGLGRAYMAGLRVALEAGADTIVHLDADGSHPPEMVPELIAELSNVDLALGSRYVPGGSMKIEWFRQIVSGVGNAYIRVLLGRRVHDWSTGFKAWRGDLLRRVLAAQPTARGYAWLMETTWIATKLGARVAERPLVFRARVHGESKFSPAIAYEDLAFAWALHRRTLVKGPKT